MRRTYKSVSVESRDRKHVVLLDGKAALTPRNSPLALPTLALAEAVAEEWRVQEKRIEPKAMPLTRLANTAIDRGERSAEQLLNYADTELLAYRAEEQALAERQSREWDPLLVWARERFGVPFVL